MPQERRRFKLESGGHRLHLAHFLACFDLPHIMDDVNFRNTDLIGEEDQVAWSSLQSSLNASLPPGAMTRIVKENAPNTVAKSAMEISDSKEERCRNERRKFLLYNNFRVETFKTKYCKDNLEDVKKDFATEVLIATMTDM